jgi:ribosomal-protein-alanine N-acetyltransferase
MDRVRKANRNDFATVASWLGSPDECRRWSGPRVSYPIDLAALHEELQYEESESWCIASGDRVVAFGQIVLKPSARLHLARLIVSPLRRGEGLGRLLTLHLLERALAERPPRVSLNVDPENDSALNIYRSLGFVLATRPADEAESESIYMEYAAQARA